VAEFRHTIDPSWVDCIEDGDYDSAARLYLEAKRDAYSPHSDQLTASQARATIRALDGRFPGVAEHAATATAEELAIVGDRSMRRTHEAERSTSGLSRADRAPARAPREPGADPLSPALDAVQSFWRLLKLTFYVAFWPWTAIFRHRARIAAHFRTTPTKPTFTEEDIPF